uniref:Uncharacterized protein n=1 Tax=Chromera velia CCMP2878 TaxID=1169474 RepID=A0A0G4I0D1_9ALVE|eukprot:Cvel_34338.t1-p1 / transcript=Cvel_34338.t1 / gene=Cvel_34338 / organism=Chromera_velia_CCMP2878 / gene_product=hypothetical protein / transcript_product=hypothetical protein / location=Cvel_scaffold5861:501-3125(+) / protein_length=287 / sequence_SO=supercontig / SO=protein_coding / is_pseudo=false
MMKAWRHNEINPLMGPDRDDELVHLKRMLQKSEWEKMEALRGRPPGGLHSTRGADSIALLQQQQQMKMQPDGRSGYEVRGGRGYTNLFKSVQENPWEWRRSYQGPPVAQDPRLLSVAPTVAGGIHGGSMAEVAINPLDAAVSDPDKQGQTLYYQTVKRPMPRFQDCHPSYSITHDVGQAAARVELSQRQQHQSTTNQIMHQQQLAGGQPVMHGFAPQSPPPGGYRAPAVMGTTGRIHQGDPSQPMSGFEGVIDATSHHDPYRTERGQKNPVYSTDGQQGGDYNCPIA